MDKMNDLNFLSKLKAAVDSGEYDPDIVKKFDEINEQADMVKGKKIPDEILNNVKEKINLLAVDKDVAENANVEYEEKMRMIEKQDAVNKQLSILMDIEDMVNNSINDMLVFIDEIDEMFGEEFLNENPVYGELYLKMTSIRNRFNKLNN